MRRLDVWPVARIVGGVLRLAFGLGGGLVAGQALGWPVAGAFVGGSLASLWSIVREARRASRLAAWLAEPSDEPAPRGAGFWGELGYRAEKLLRQRERTIASERERLAQFLGGIEASPNGVLLLDAAGCIEWCNGAAAAHFGLDPQRDLRHHATNLIRSPLFVAHLQGGAFDEAVTLPGGGGRGTLQVLVRPYGEGLKLVLSQDITERERTEAMRRDFVANVSHEIRTPLTVLAGFVETLAHLPLTEGERARVLGLMQQQTDRMQALVADLLTLARLEGSPPPPSDRWSGVRTLMEAVRADALALSGQRHRIEFEFPRPRTGGDAEIAGNEPELLSALGNLLANAVRYTPEGGRITARWLWRNDGSGCFEVADTGIGIAREHLFRITERFYRVDGSRSRETGGTGLGLSIVKHVVQRHGGEVLVESEPGRGSIFRLVLPAARLRRRAAGSEPLAA